MKRSIVFLLASLAGLAAHAEEGMWTFDNPPRAAIRQAYGVEVTDAWLEAAAARHDPFWRKAVPRRSFRATA